MGDLSSILKIKSGNIAPSAGKALISEPFLNDFFFRRAVILLTDHNAQGSVGFVLNNISDYTLGEIALNEFPGHNDIKIYFGGPVQTDSLFFIHTFGELVEHSLPVFNGLFWGGNLETIKALLNADPESKKNVRFFLGYSGWEAGQLDNELAINSWVVSDITKEEVLHNDYKNMWKNKVRSMGRDYMHWINFPVNPIDN